MAVYCTSTHETPFDWGLDSVPHRREPGYYVAKLTQKEHGTSWEMYKKQLTLLHEYYLLGDLGKCWYCLDQCDENITSDERLIKKNIRILRSLTTECRIFISKNSSTKTITDEVYKNRILKEDMTNDENATLYGIQASLHLGFGPEGIITAQKLTQMSLALDPLEPEWNFLAGYLIKRMRHWRFPYPLPTLQEVNYLRKAYELEKSADYTFFLADVYIESVKRKYYEDENNRKETREVLQRGIKLLKEAEKLNEEKNSSLIIRIAKTWDYLPNEYRESGKAMEFLKECLKNRPNSSFLHHTLANVYLHMKKVNEFKYHLERANEDVTNVAATLQLIEFNYRTEKKIPNFIILLERDVHDVIKIKIHVCAIGYFLFPGNDLEKAAKHFLDAIKISHISSYYERAPLNWYSKPHFFKLYDGLYTDVSVALMKDTCSKKGLELLAEVKIKLENMYPNITKRDENWKEEEINDSSSTYIKNKFWDMFYIN